jgi:HPr kinase/phosphorylase
MRAQGISVQHLLAGSEGRLGLRQVIGAKGLENRLHHVQVQHYMDGDVSGSLVHDMILIMDPAQDRPLIRKDDETCMTFLEKIKTAKIPCIFMSASEKIAEHLCHLTKPTGILLLASAHDPYVLESRLKGLLREKISHRIMVHGVLLRMFGMGVMIQGDSGVGKTTAGMMLVQKGHTWIADDAVEIEKRRGQRLYAKGCKSIRHLVDLKEFGIRDAKRLFDDHRRAAGTDLDLILDMEQRGDDLSRPDSDSFRNIREIMGMQIPCIHIPPCRDHDFDILAIEKRVAVFRRDGGTS